MEEEKSDEYSNNMTEAMGAGKHILRYMFGILRVYLMIHWSDTGLFRLLSRFKILC